MSADLPDESFAPLPGSPLGEVLASAADVEEAADALARFLVERFAEVGLVSVLIEDEPPLRLLAERSAAGELRCRATRLEADIAAPVAGSRLTRELSYGGKCLGRIVVVRRDSSFRSSEASAFARLCLELGSYLSSVMLKSAAARARVSGHRLADFAAVLSRTVASSGILDVAVRRLCRALASSEGRCYLASDDGRRLSLVGSTHMRDDADSCAVFVPYSSLYALAFERQQPLFIESSALLNARCGLPPDELKLRGGASVVVPLLAASRQVLGLLELSFKHPRSFSDSERSFIDSAAIIVGSSLERAQIYDRERVERYRAECLRDVMGALLLATTEDEAARVIVRGLRALGAPRCAVHVQSALGADWRLAAQAGLGPDTQRRVASISPDSADPVAVAARNQRLSFDESSADGSIHAFVACAPMTADGEVVEGVMQVGYPEPRLLTASERSYMSELGTAGARALARLRCLGRESSTRLAVERVASTAST